jgi:hypothetical protein
MQSKHTPGPWTVRPATGEGDNIVTTLATSGARINTRLFEITADANPTPADQKANARLIARAPEMYEALNEIADLLTTHPDARRGNSIIHLALTKARARLAPCHFHDFEVPTYGMGG